MGSKKSKTTNTPAYITPPPTESSTRLKNMVGKVDYETPLRNQYARAQRDIDRSYHNPLGAYTTADVRDKSIREQKFDLNQNLGMALADAAMAEQRAAFGQQATVAELLQPRLYTKESTTRTSDPFGTALQIGSLGVGGLVGGMNAKR